MRELVIIGSGPAGYTAAIYAARANLAPLVIASSVEFGGDLMNTTDVDNFPGFPEGIMGPELMMQMQKQAERFGAEIVYDDVASVSLDGPTKNLTLGNGVTSLIHHSRHASRVLRPMPACRIVTLVRRGPEFGPSHQAQLFQPLAPLVGPASS